MIKDNREILYGDVSDKLLLIPNEFVDCIITSFPYWMLRDYGVKKQIGLEKTFTEFLDTMAKIMEQCWRILKRTGTCWINLGDTYGTDKSGKPDEKTRTNPFIPTDENTDIKSLALEYPRDSISIV